MSATTVEPTSSVRASAALVVERRPGGASRIARLRSDPPLVVRRTGVDQVHLVGVGGGPVAGDRLSLWIDVGDGATLTVRQVAASVALPAPAPSGPSRLDITVRVGHGGRLAWWGEPTVGAAGCDHEIDLDFEVTEDAELLWRDEVVLGRSGEKGGRVRTRTTLTRGGRVRLRSDTAAGGPAWASPAVAGGARVHGTLLAVGAPALAVADPRVASATRLAVTADVVVLSALGSDHTSVRGPLDRGAGAAADGPRAAGDGDGGRPTV